LRQEDGAAFAVTDGLTRVLSPSFSRDGRSLYYVSNRAGSMDLWQQALGADGRPEDDPIPLTVGIGMRSAVLSPDGTKLAYSKGRLVANLWRVPLLENRPAVWADAEQLTFDEALVEFFDVSNDGQRLVFNSDRTGNMDLWVMPAEGGALSALTTGPELDWHPQWSPSGDEVAFYSLRSGRREIHVLPLDGGPGVQLTNGEAEGSESWFPAWSPDGSEIAFGTLRDDAWSLRTIPREGGVPRLVHTEKDQLHPTWTPDGPGVLFPSADDCLWQVPADGGEPVRVLCGVAGWPAVSLDGKRIFFTRGTEAGRDIWAFAPEDGTEQRLTQLEGRPGTLRTQIATDGRFLYFGWQEDVGDLWVMDVVREP
ncbi:MAG TPA: hypothetical protein VEK15_21855, partial [Vicinamibacteria bacterium]|nr:hypothetical protein [Vicinamibacteria bacterium]